MLSGIGTGTHSHRLEDERTRLALARAKEVLVHYALNDPNRPGELPCPDLDNDGRLLLNVDFRGGRDVPCASRRGWLPFRTLGSDELRDGAGERLWYALSDTYHAGHSAPLNSEVAGELSVGAAGDIAAVVIAPGFPVDERQARQREEEGSPPDARRLVSAYLEGANADAALDHYAHPSRPRPEENDRVLPITRRELAAVVEKRVLGEVAAALAAFYREHGTLPWLVPLGDPGAASLRAVPGTREGRLAFQRAGDRVETGALRARWALSGATVSSWGSVDHALLVSGDARFGHGPGPSGAPVCRFVQAEEIDCTASERLAAACRGVPGTPVERTYRLRLRGEGSAVTAPDAARVRRRAVSVNREDAPGPVSAVHGVGIAIEDVALSGPRAGERCGAGALTDTASAWGYVEVSEVRHPLVLGTELPAWFVDERWYGLTYLAFAAPLAPSAAPRPCESGVDCLVLEGAQPAGDKQAVVVVASAALPGQSRGAWSVDAYFERDNASPADDAFTARAPPGEEFNDQVRVVALTP